ncbi:MAG: glycosyltransferase [Acidobacteria bacterium]|nr:glycosyltransferase [Acidobacteriota bacterium]
MTDVTRVLELRSVRGTGGGPEKTILLGAAHHDPRRFRVTVCYIRDDRDRVFGIDERARRLDIEYVEVRERHSFDRRIWPALAAICRDRAIDVVHGHDYKTNLLAWLLSRRLDVVPIGTAHGWTGQSARERWVYYPLDRQVLRRLPRVIAVSTDIRDRLIASGADPARITVLLNGIDPDAFRRQRGERDARRAALGFQPHHRIIATVGRLERQKRVDLLLEAFARVHVARPETRLVVVGDGSLRASLETQSRRMGVDAACLFLGHRLDIARLHDAFDVFVQASEYEGTPNAVLEAMALETPIVATDVGGTRELARPDVDALIVPPHDTHALAHAVEQVLADPAAAAARVVSARRRIERDLSFAERTRTLERIYDELVQARRRAEPAGMVDVGRA